MSFLEPCKRHAPFQFLGGRGTFPFTFNLLAAFLAPFCPSCWLWVIYFMGGLAAKVGAAW